MAKNGTIRVRGNSPGAPLGIVALLGAGAGFLLSRSLRRETASAVHHLSRALTRQAALSTTGPIIAAAISSTGIIIAAILIPGVVVWVLTRRNSS